MSLTRMAEDLSRDVSILERSLMMEQQRNTHLMGMIVDRENLKPPAPIIINTAYTRELEIDLSKMKIELERANKEIDSFTRQSKRMREILDQKNIVVQEQKARINQLMERNQRQAETIGNYQSELSKLVRMRS